MPGLVKIGAALLTILGCAAPLMGQTRSVDLSLHALGVFSRRSAAFAGDAGVGSGRMAGGEFRARGRLWGATVRWAGGSFAADSGTEAVGSLAQGEIDLTLGPRVIAGIVGYGRRSFTGAVGTRRWSLMRVGAETRLPLGTTGLHAEGRVIRAFALSAGESGGHGTLVETRLAFAPTHLPISVAIGYRSATFVAESESGIRPDDVTGPLIVVGVRWP